MKLIGVLGSPRKGGNSDILLEEALRGAREAGAETEKIILEKLQIHGCRDCKGCNKTGICVIDDDMKPVLDKILNAQCIIHSGPVYFYSMSAQMKAYLDRWTALFDGDWEPHKHYEPKLKGKKIVAISVCGDSKVETAELAIEPFRLTVRFLPNLLEWGGSLVVPSVSDKGEVQNSKKHLEKAYQLGRQLV